MTMQYEQILEFIQLLVGSVIYRPYVYIFFVCFVVFSVHQTGWIKTALFTVMAWTLAFAAEWSATRNGFPFGIYHYIDTTRTRELWVSNVPFWDSLSFVFLSYFTFNLAGVLLSKRKDLSRGLISGIRHPIAPVVGGFLMMLLDMVIDPVTLQGDKWFLGQIYFYPIPGPHFGVTLENYAGWLLLGVVTQFLYQRIFFANKLSLERIPNLFSWGLFGVYFGVLGFMIGVTIYINDISLLKSHLLIVTLVTVPIVNRLLFLTDQRAMGISDDQAAQAL